MDVESLCVVFLFLRLALGVSSFDQGIMTSSICVGDWNQPTVHKTRLFFTIFLSITVTFLPSVFITDLTIMMNYGEVLKGSNWIEAMLYLSWLPIDPSSFWFPIWGSAPANPLTIYAGDWLVKTPGPPVYLWCWHSPLTKPLLPQAPVPKPVVIRLAIEECREAQVCLGLSGPTSLFMMVRKNTRDDSPFLSVFTPAHCKSCSLSLNIIFLFVKLWCTILDKATGVWWQDSLVKPQTHLALSSITQMFCLILSL